jgi:hypothetical protein
MTRGRGLGREDLRDLARCWAAFASLGAGLVHLAVVQEHLAEWWLYGVFFAALGVAQVGWALAALARDTAPVLRPVVLVNLGVVSLWAVTRTVGLPVGPEPWQPEPAGRPDVLATLLEVAVVVALLVVARTTRRPVPAGRPVARFVALMFAGALAVSAVTTPALAATPAGGRAHHHLQEH